ncbi:hypothetical protein JCM19992_01480 [Thermostilla marina]
MKKYATPVFFLLAATIVSQAWGQSPAQARRRETPQQRAERMRWWTEARFGMFVHWGVYAATGGEFRGYMPPNSAEWMMNRAKVPIADYIEENVKKFNPVEFDADAFVGLAKEAGMKYLIFTAKHHDGFAMFHSKCSDYNVVDMTPFGRDVVEELAEACRKHGLRFGLYYSQAQDWHHPGGFGNNWDKTLEHVDSDIYVREKAVPEVRQLLTEYGPIAVFWWDTPRQMSRESLDSLYSLTGLQPGIITNDRLGEEYPGDYKTFERQIPERAPAVPYWEVCMPISGSWGYKKTDTDFKSTTTLIRNLIDIASKGGNYLLNVGPTGEGVLLPQAVERLKAIGRWMKVNGESIYGTSASPFPPFDWGRCTMKSDGEATTLYLHVFDWPADGKLLVPGLKNPVLAARLLADDRKVAASPVDEGVLLTLPGEAPDPYASVVALRVAGEPEVEAVLPQPNAEGVLTLYADDAYLHNNEGASPIRVRNQETTPNLGYWTDPNAWVEWEFRIDKPGRYAVSAVVAVQEPKTRFRVRIGDHELVLESASTGGYGEYVTQSWGTVELDKSGAYSLSIRPEPDAWQPINLRQVRLVRQ